MSPLRADDLPKHVRDRLTGDQPEATEKPVTAKPSDSGPAYRCHYCGEEFDRWGAAAERHAAKPGHSRMDMVLRTEST